MNRQQAVAQLVDMVHLDVVLNNVLPEEAISHLIAAFENNKYKLSPSAQEAMRQVTLEAVQTVTSGMTK